MACAEISGSFSVLMASPMLVWRPLTTPLIFEVGSGNLAPIRFGYACVGQNAFNEEWTMVETSVISAIQMAMQMKFFEDDYSRLYASNSLRIAKLRAGNNRWSSIPCLYVSLFGSCLC